MLHILSNLPATMKIKILGTGCRDIVTEESKKFKQDQLILLGPVPHQECLEEIEKSNILINLGNTVTNQMPSKLFEYINLGKPILNFYFTKEDMCLKVFKKYPLAFNFNLNDYTQDDIDEMIKFIEDNKNSSLSYNDATKGLSQYKVSQVADKISRSITNA